MLTGVETTLINPYIAGSPVKDAAMFFGREDVFAWLRQHLRGAYQDNPIVLYGERRSGKTSVLYQMKDRLDDDHYLPVLLDLQGMGLEGLDGFLWEVARRIVLTLRSLEGIPPLERPARQDFEANPRHQFEEVFLPSVVSAIGQRSILLMFDEANRLTEKVETDDLQPDIFDYLRALIQQANHLSFLFALGNRIEANSPGASHLFNLAVYHKISFLDEDFAKDLIIQPVAGYYTYTPAAIERIYTLTAGQPYYTQLLCHNLFARWTIERPAQLDIGDVEAVIPDVLEQGTPNFQFVWTDSTPAEKAILVALAEAVPHHHDGVMRRNLERTLERAKLYPPSGEVTNGLRNLFERDVINNQETYQFQMGLMQRWLHKFRRLDWVYEELGEVARQWEQLKNQHQSLPSRQEQRFQRWAIAFLVILLIAGTIYGVMARQYSAAALEAAESRRATEVAQLAATVAANSTLSAQNQSALVIASTKAAEAATRGDRQEAAAARATAAALQMLNEALAATATSAVAIGETAQAQLLLISEPTATLTAIPPTLTDTPTPTATATPMPPTPTPTSTPLPLTPTLISLPAATPTPRLQGIIAYPAFSDRTGTYNIYFFDINNNITILRRSQASQPAFNADGSRLAFLSWSGDRRGLVTTSRADGNETLISAAPEDKLPTWSPDSSTVLFFTRRAGNRASEIYLTSANQQFFNYQTQTFVPMGNTPPGALPASLFLGPKIAPG
jgi:hypothetical protein